MSSPVPLNSMVHQHNSFLISILDSFATFSFRHICLASLTMFTVKGKCWPHIRITGGGFLKIFMPRWHPWPVKSESLDVCPGISCSLPCPGDTNDPQVIPMIPALKPLSLTFSLFPHPSLPPPWWEWSKFSDGNGTAGADLLLSSLRIFLPALQKGKGPGSHKMREEFSNYLPKNLKLRSPVLE